MHHGRRIEQCPLGRVAHLGRLFGRGLLLQVRAQLQRPRLAGRMQAVLVLEPGAVILHHAAEGVSREPKKKSKQKFKNAAVLSFAARNGAIS